MIETQINENEEIMQFNWFPTLAFNLLYWTFKINFQELLVSKLIAF